MGKARSRCAWCLSNDLMMQYHDEVWGVPEFNDQALFAKLCLDGAQAGLSWLTILKKQENYYKAFDQFDPEKMARYSEKRIEKLLQDPGIVRNRLKVRAFVTNAQAYLKLKEEQSFNQYIWSFVDGKPIVNTYRSLKDLPANNAISDALSKDLKKRGFKFVGSTIVYAFMQAVGMVNDHETDCFRHKEVGKIQSNIK